MTNSVTDKKASGELLKVLAVHYRALVSARCDEAILRQYASLLRALKSRPSQFFDGNNEVDTVRTIPLSEISHEQLQIASLSDLEKIINDSGTTRKGLEFIAIQRFSVPSGSMRSFSNRQMLVDKLRTLIANEKTHDTIGAVARGQQT